MEDSQRLCPDCGAEALKKQISKVAFRLKGTGWDETDFKDNKKAPAKSDGGEGKSSDDSKSKSGDTKKSDNKSATKSAPSGSD